jgi:hypothetical protein
MKTVDTALTVVGLLIGTIFGQLVYNKFNSSKVVVNDVKDLESILTVEFTKAGMVAPPLKFEQPASIHIITDEKNTLIDVQVIPIVNKN